MGAELWIKRPCEGHGLIAPHPGDNYNIVDRCCGSEERLDPERVLIDRLEGDDLIKLLSDAVQSEGPHLAPITVQDVLDALAAVPPKEKT